MKYSFKGFPFTMELLALLYNLYPRTFSIALTLSELTQQLMILLFPSKLVCLKSQYLVLYFSPFIPPPLIKSSIIPPYHFIFMLMTPKCIYHFHLLIAILASPPSLPLLTLSIHGLPPIALQSTPLKLNTSSLAHLSNVQKSSPYLLCFVGPPSNLLILLVILV